MAATAVVQKTKEPIAVKATTATGFFEEMGKTLDAISRKAFEIFEGNGRLIGHDLENWFKAEADLFHPVHLNVTESDDSIEVKAEVPGFNENELQVTMEPNRLTICGKRETSKEEKKGKTVYSEKCSNEIFRVVDLPAEVDTSKVTATLKNGTLELTMPKAPKAQAVPIRPQAAA
jgi:HSP20 family protein